MSLVVQRQTINPIPVQIRCLVRLAGFSSPNHRLLLLSSHALHPSRLLKARPAGPGCTCVVQQQRNRPKLLTALPLHFLPPSISTGPSLPSSTHALSFPAAPASCSVWTAASWKPATPERLLLLRAGRALCSQRAALWAVDLHVVTCQHGEEKKIVTRTEALRLQTKERGIGWESDHTGPGRPSGFSVPCYELLTRFVK